jgi:PAS domain S-box-containing protein
MTVKASRTDRDDEMDELRNQLLEAEETLEAIRHGAVDALVVKQRDKQQIFTLQSADHTYRVLIESMSQAAITIGSDGTILYSNSQFSRMLGKPLELIIGARFQSLFDLKDQPKLENLIEQNDIQKDLNSQGHYELELDLPGEVLTSVIISVTQLPEVEANAYMGVIITDITERKRAEKAKDEFISLASHQLRTPATGVKQYLGMLIEGYVGDMEETQLAFVKTAYDSNEKQINIISSILKTAQIDSGAYKVMKTPQSLLALIDTVLTDFKPVFMMRGQRLKVEVSPELEVNVDGDELCVALSNLIENASKYSPDGTEIIIKATQTSKATTIRVTDKGVGIDKADQVKIFEKFTRVDNAMSDTVNGSGLGLYWVKRIVTMHGGSITIDSVLDKGTTFIVKLPR